MKVEVVLGEEFKQYIKWLVAQIKDKE